jgi:hypothetical protein
MRSCIDALCILCDAGSVVVHMIGKEGRPLATKVTGGAWMDSADQFADRGAY